MMTVMSTTGHHYPRYYVLLMHATSQLQRAVHWPPERLYLHIFPEEAAMQDNDTLLELSSASSREHRLQ